MSRIASLILVSLTLFAMAIPQAQAYIGKRTITTPGGMHRMTMRRGPFGRTVLRTKRLHGGRWVKGRTIVRGPFGHIRIR